MRFKNRERERDRESVGGEDDGRRSWRGGEGDSGQGGGEVIAIAGASSINFFH